MNRRTFLRRTALAGTVGLGLAGWRPRHALAEPPPETKRIRLTHRPSVCEAPNYVAEELLQAEGFREIQYVKRGEAAAEGALTAGDADMSMLFGPPMILRIDAGEPLVFLAGVHVGCAEVFGTERVRTVSDLKGKRVGIEAHRDVFHVFVASMASHVGLRPERDINWVIAPYADYPQMLVAGEIDAFLAGPPVVQEMHARKIGRVVVNMLADRPYYHYFCCMIVANKEFVHRYPIATKRAMRAILKASELCARQPERIARFLFDKGYAERSDYAVQAMKEVVYGKWREYDAADTIRFYSLRLHEAGMIKSSPQKIIAQGTDWRFLKELKKELKG
jgi:NitT/TauT family transport system substrate-binding protein